MKLNEFYILMFLYIGGKMFTALYIFIFSISTVVVPLIAALIPFYP